MTNIIVLKCSNSIAKIKSINFNIYIQNWLASLENLLFKSNLLRRFAAFDLIKFHLFSFDFVIHFFVFVNCNTKTDNRTVILKWNEAVAAIWYGLGEHFQGILDDSYHFLNKIVNKLKRNKQRAERDDFFLLLILRNCSTIGIHCTKQYDK